MIIEDIDENNAAALCELYNNSAEGETIYKKLDRRKFDELFKNKTKHAYIVTLVAVEDSKPIGFVSGCVTLTGICYLTFLLVNSEYREKGIGKALLKGLEQKFKVEHGASSCTVSFRNPCHLPWIIPITGKREHLNSPGVDISSRAYIFFKNQGYFEVSYENCFYRSLENFVMPEEITNEIKKLEEEDVFFCDGDKNIHIGFNRLFDDLKNEEWRATVFNELEKVDGNRIIIARKGIHPIGFAGPVSLAEDKRGIFCGIGVITDYRKKGIGKALFYSLCNAFHQEGAEYVTLFTNNSGTAAPIYKTAGLRVVRVWATMSKEL